MAEQVPNDETQINSETRIELLERNLRYIQERHESILTDLHHEINRLQQENQNLHYQLMNSSKSEEKSIPNCDLQQRIDELEKRLLQSEERNQSLTKRITELNQIVSSKSDNQSDLDDRSSSDHDYQHLLNINTEKQQLYLQEITKLRSIILEILNTERLNLSSRTLLRECLTSSNISELSINKNTTTPTGVLFTTDKQQFRSNLSPSLTGKTASYRSTTNLPAIHSTLSQHSAMSPINYSQYPCMVKVGETPIARREKRTQEIQKNRLMKHLYH